MLDLRNFVDSERRNFVSLNGIYLIKQTGGVTQHKPTESTQVTVNNEWKLKADCSKLMADS